MALAAASGVTELAPAPVCTPDADAEFAAAAGAGDAPGRRPLDTSRIESVTIPATAARPVPRMRVAGKARTTPAAEVRSALQRGLDLRAGQRARCGFAVLSLDRRESRGREIRKTGRSSDSGVFLMPTIQRAVSVAAGATDPNLLTGSVFEFARGNVLLIAGVTASVTGTFVTINSGSDVVLEESPPFVAANDWPIIPDQMYYSDAAAIGDRIVIAARNPTGGAVIHRPLVQIINT